MSRVLHVVWSMDPTTGGLSRAVALIANTQARAGLEVVVLTTRSGPPTPAQDVVGLAPEVQVIEFARSRLTARFAGSRTLGRWLRANVTARDTVHVHAVWDIASSTGARVARSRRAHLVLSPHGSLEPFDLRKHAPAKKVLGRLVVRPSLRAGVVHCTTHREADCLETYGARPDVHVIPLPADDPPGPAERNDFRVSHGLTAQEPLLLFLGRVDYKKGIAHLLQAMVQMTQPARLVIAGSGEPGYVEEVRALATELGLSDRVVWVGWLGPEDRRDAYFSCDVFVLLSDAENFGIVVVEALQHDCVVVASEQVGVAVDVADQGGVLLAQRDPRSAAAVLDKALSDADLRERTRERAQQVLREDFDPVALADRYTGLTRRSRR